LRASAVPGLVYAARPRRLTMAPGTRTGTKALLLGACVFGVGYASGQAIVKAEPLPSVPTVSVPVPTISVPSTPTVPTVPTASEPPPTTSVPSEGPPAVHTSAGAQAPPVAGASAPGSPSTHRLRAPVSRGAQRSQPAVQRRHLATTGTGTARASRPRLTRPGARASAARPGGPGSSGHSRARARANHSGSSNPLEAIGRHLPLPIPVPDWSKPIIAALVVVAIWFGACFRRAATRARRLERRDEVLLHDVDTMQAALVPEVPALVEGVPVSVAYRPAAGPAAGGDFYDVFVPRPGKLALMLGDVCGHGREAVAHAALCRYTLRAYLQVSLEPRRALAVAGRVLADPLGSSYVTVALALYDAHSGTLTYANAGHPRPVIYGFRARPQPSKAASPPIGWGLPTGRRQTKISLPAGAEVCFYSDGLTDARRAGEPLGRERLVEILHSLGPKPSAALLLAQVRAAAESTPDDMAACILAPDGPDDCAYAHVEELEADEGALSGPQVRAFLEECELPDEEIADALARAHGIADMCETALLSIHLTPAGATATVTAPAAGAQEVTPPRSRTSPRPREPAAPRVQPSAGT
jgi:Stage II sporulation protein E (SpoIIE)